MDVRAARLHTWLTEQLAGQGVATPDARFSPVSGDASFRRYFRLAWQVGDASASVIGVDAPRIESALEGSGVPVMYARDMDEAVSLAWGEAAPGDAVLLSPACASVDMYRNYQHRAEVFIKAVRALVAHGGGR